MNNSHIIEKEYKFKYAGESSYINLNTLIMSQMYFSAMLNEINKEISPENELQIKIKSFSEGSFIVDLLYQLVPVAPIVMSSVSYETLINLFDMLKNYIDLRTFLGGEKADNIIESGENVTVMKGDNNVVVSKVVFNTYIGNEVLDKLSRDAFNTLDNDQEVDGLKIIEDDESLLSINKKDFKSLKAANKYFDEKTEVVKEDVYMSILKADFDTSKRGTWRLLYNVMKV